MSKPQIVPVNVPEEVATISDEELASEAVKFDTSTPQRTKLLSLARKNVFVSLHDGTSLIGYLSVYSFGEYFSVGRSGIKYRHYLVESIREV